MNHSGTSVRIFQKLQGLGAQDAWHGSDIAIELAAQPMKPSKTQESGMDNMAVSLMWISRKLLGSGRSLGLDYGHSFGFVFAQGIPTHPDPYLLKALTNLP